MSSIKRKFRKLVIKWDPELPRTKEGIEALQHECILLPSDLKEARVEHHPNGDKTIYMSRNTVRLMKLQRQLFRVVFHREPEKHDPVFWDRERENEGVFPVDLDNERTSLSRSLPATGIRPAQAYAISMTERIITEDNQHLHSADELKEWEDAVEEYERQQRNGGVLPVAPHELISALETVNANVPDNPNRLIALLRECLGSENKAVAAADRLGALLSLRDTHPELDEGGLGLSEDTLAAAATCPLKGGSFDLQEFWRKKGSG